jgi:hypothetical protein
MYLRTLFGAAPYRHFLSLPLLSLYCALLVATAVPRSFLPRPLARAHRASSLVFKHGLEYMPGVNLFRGVALNRKVALACLTVIGVRANEERIGFQTFPGCIAPAVQFRRDSFAFGLTRVAWWLSKGGGNDARNDNKLAAFGRYFCRSKQSPLSGSDDVVFVVDLDVQDYATGAITETLRVLHTERCGPPDGSTPAVPYTAHKRPDGRITVLPVAPS